jgi:hypothetical protein
MMLELPVALGDELLTTLDEVIGDLSVEIADTDNPGFRRDLKARRERLEAIRSRLVTASTV